MSDRDHASRMFVLLPSLRISGGVQEALRLASALQQRGVDVTLVAMWKHTHESPHPNLKVEYLSCYSPNKMKAVFQLFSILRTFRQFAGKWMSDGGTKNAVMFTHYSTFLLFFLSRQAQRFCFNQDLEWCFVPAGILRKIVKDLVLRVSARSFVVTSNQYISTRYRQYGIEVAAQASTWATPFWKAESCGSSRDIDVIVLLRQGAVKRFDLYEEFLRMARERKRMDVAVVTPDDEIAEKVQQFNYKIYLRPSDQELRDLYGRAKVFLLLSDLEGFGLPPLEAMGSGCVPLCRNSGGVTNYMQGDFESCLIPLNENIEEIMDRLENLLDTDVGALSAAARLVYEAGSKRSEEERAVCFDLIVRRFALQSQLP